MMVIHESTNRSFRKQCVYWYGMILVEEMRDIFFKRSATSGDSFQDTKDLSNGKDGEAQINILLKKEIMCMWYGQKMRADDIYFKRSTNNGASFGSTINLSNDDNSSVSPEIAVVGDNVYVVWVDSVRMKIRLNYFLKGVLIMEQVLEV